MQDEGLYAVYVDDHLVGEYAYHHLGQARDAMGTQIAALTAEAILGRLAAQSTVKLVRPDGSVKLDITVHHHPIA